MLIRKAIRGIGVDGVASEIGALGRYQKDPFRVNEQDLIVSLMKRFKAERWEAREAIWQAIEVNVVKRENRFIILVVE